MTPSESQLKIRAQYGAVAAQDSCAAPRCCGEPDRSAAKSLGYSDEQLAVIPSEADLGLGYRGRRLCGR